MTGGEVARDYCASCSARVARRDATTTAAPELSAQPDSASPDGGGLARELAELERTRKDFEDLSRRLNEQRAELERETERAKSRQNIRFVAAALGVLVLLVGGLAWLSRKRKTQDSA